MILDQFGNEMPRSVVMARLISKLHNLSGLLIIPVDEEEARKLIQYYSTLNKSHQRTYDEWARRN